MRKIVIYLFCLLIVPRIAAPQAASSKISADLRPFVREDAPVIALTHVRDRRHGLRRTSPIRRWSSAGGKIVAIGPADATKAPAGAKILDLTGRSVIPGLFGMHDHMYYPSPGRSVPLYPEHASSFPRLYLAGGVTSIRTDRQRRDLHGPGTQARHR